jgi:hypothetical protein
MKTREPTPAKPWYTSKFFWLAAALALLDGVAAGIDQSKTVTGLHIPGWVYMIQALLVSGVLPILRQYTTGPIIAGNLIKQITIIIVVAGLSSVGTYAVSSAVADPTPDAPVEDVQDVPDAPDAGSSPYSDTSLTLE